jgi:hypothetical protein
MGTSVAVVDAVFWGDDGERILDRIDAAHGLEHEKLQATVRRYTFTSFESNADAIAWLEAEALAIAPNALDYPRVRFGVPGKNAP